MFFLDSKDTATFSRFSLVTNTTKTVFKNKYLFLPYETLKKDCYANIKQDLHLNLRFRRPLSRKYTECTRAAAAVRGGGEYFVPFD